MAQVIGASIFRSRVVLSGVIAAAVDAAYLGLVSNQSEGFTARAAFVSAYIAVVAILLFLSAFVQGSTAKAWLLMFATTSLFLLGFLGLFSIGLPLMVGAFLAMPDTARALQAVPENSGRIVAVLGAVASVGVIVVGIAATG